MRWLQSPSRRGPVRNGRPRQEKSRRADRPVERRAIVTGELENGLTYLEVIGEEGQPKIARIHVKVFVASGNAAATGALFDQLLDRLPLVCTLRAAAVRLSVELIHTS